MEFLNDDMDRFFKKAAEEYPLKTGDGDWDKIAGRIKSPGKDRRKLLIAALLLLIASSTAIWVYHTSSHSANIKTADHTQPANKNEEKKNSVPAKPTGPSIAPGADITGKNEVDLSYNNNIHNPAALSYRKNVTAAKSIKDFSDYNPSVLTNNEIPGNKDNGKQPEITLGQNAQNNNSGTQPETDITQNPAANTKLSAIEPGQSKQAVIPEKKQDDKQKENMYFYAGLVASPVFTSVKSQDVQSGYSVGLLAGLHVTKNISVETGVRKEMRKINTDGKYFSNEYLKLKNTTSLEHAKGDVKITNIPVFVKYDIPIKNNNNFFISAGTNLAIVHKENYDFSLMRNGVEANVNRTFYSKPPNKMFTDFIVSGGFEKSIMEKGKLRIEPWYSLPVHGLGMGQVKASNMGVNLGVTLDFK